MEKTRPSLENLVEGEDLGFEILPPGGLEITQEFADPCRIGKGTYVLDVASGTGETVCYLAEEVGVRVVGVDGSGLMIERSQEKARQRNLEIGFKKGDAHQLPFGDNTFDVVISEFRMCILGKEKASRNWDLLLLPDRR